ncbi:hypothetical protein D9611_008636 [Ephemerocybe angulata]|uniref:Uncharacterized protein n=1 Tax=Ephemerocybe angulata TaxID=980116 RepID=A0A8H5EUY2_9AGAR|nr:hypothetical protein D9611_008636 [Tulosesus angulatus]
MDWDGRLDDCLDSYGLGTRRYTEETTGTLGITIDRLKTLRDGQEREGTRAEVEEKVGDRGQGQGSRASRTHGVAMLCSDTRCRASADASGRLDSEDRGTDVFNCRVPRVLVLQKRGTAVGLRVQDGTRVPLQQLHAFTEARARTTEATEGGL